MATKLLASKATVEHRMYKFSSTEGSVWRFHVGFRSDSDWGFPVRFSGYLLLVLVSAKQWKMSVDNQTERKTEMKFRRTCSKAFQPQSDPEALRTLPSRSSLSLGGRALLRPPFFRRIPHKTDVEVKEKQVGPVFGFRTQPRLGIGAGTVLRSPRFCKLCETTKPFWHHLSAKCNIMLNDENEGISKQNKRQIPRHPGETASISLTTL